MKNTGDGRPVKGKLLQDEDGIWHEVPVSSMSIPKKPEKFDADHLPAPNRYGLEEQVKDIKNKESV